MFYRYFIYFLGVSEIDVFIRIFKNRVEHFIFAVFETFFLIKVRGSVVNQTSTLKMKGLRVH